MCFFLASCRNPDVSPGHHCIVLSIFVIPVSVERASWDHASTGIEKHSNGMSALSGLSVSSVIINE